MNKPVDWSKPIQGSDGKKLKVLVTDRPGPWFKDRPVVVMDLEKGLTYSCQLDGSVAAFKWRVVNIPERTSKFYNIWPSLSAADYQYGTLEAARAASSDAVLAVVEVIIEDGVVVDAKIHPAK